MVLGQCEDRSGDACHVHTIPLRRVSQESAPGPDASTLLPRREASRSQRPLRPQARQTKDRRTAPPRRAPRLERLNGNAAGIDVGAEYHWVAVPDDRDAEPVQRFATFTVDLYALADWLTQCGIETVVMESTGVYWMPLFEVLEERGFTVSLVDPHHVKQVPGRKTDVQDCQWWQELHTYGLWRGAFRPPEAVCVLRSSLRQRSLLIEEASRTVQHMQKALEHMNLKLTAVVSDITGHTGMGIMRAILAGERDPQALATRRDKRCKCDQATLAKALEGPAGAFQQGITVMNKPLCNGCL